MSELSGHVTRVARSSPLDFQQHCNALCTSGFVDDAMFSYDGGVGSVVERRSLAGGLSLSCARPAANG